MQGVKSKYVPQLLFDRAMFRHWGSVRLFGSGAIQLLEHGVNILIHDFRILGGQRKKPGHRQSCECGTLDFFDGKLFLERANRALEST